MLDWNGNGKIDPVDIGISIATEEAKSDAADVVEATTHTENDYRGGCLTVMLVPVIFIATLRILFGVLI